LTYSALSKNGSDFLLEDVRLETGFIRPEQVTGMVERSCTNRRQTTHRLQTLEFMAGTIPQDVSWPSTPQTT